MVRQEAEGFSLIKTCAKAKTPTREENLELVRRIQAGDKEAESEFVIRNGKLVITVINNKFNMYIDNEDVFQAGLLGLLKAAEKFDLKDKSDISVATYAYIWIRQSIGRYISENENDIRLPVHAHEKLKKMMAIRNKYNTEKPECTLEMYIKQETGFDDNVINTLMPYTLHTISLNEPVKLDSDSRDDSEIIDFIDDKINSTEDDVVEQFRDEAVYNVMKEALNEREFDVICRRFGIGYEQMTLEEVGKAYGITRERIRQIEVKALRKLRNPRYKRLLQDYVNA